MKTAIVSTSIGVPYALKTAYENAISHHHDPTIIFVGDNKTPEEAFQFVKDNIPNSEAWTIENQKMWIKQEYGEKYLEIFAENNYQRRILGFLMAKELGAENIIILDDDNFPKPNEDFITLHKVGHRGSFTSISSNTGYINECDFLGLKEKVFVRGYPLSLRKTINYNQNIIKNRVVSNIGLWAISPDICAIDHIAYPDVSVKEDYLSTLAVAPKNYISYCVQNLSFHIDTLPCQYEFPMGEYINNIKIGRFDDIAQGLILKRVVDAMGDIITFGSPQTIHKRHPHDYYKDLAQEYFSDYIIEWIINALNRIELFGSESYFDTMINCLKELKYEAFSISYSPVRKYIAKVFNNWFLWLELISEVK